MFLSFIAMDYYTGSTQQSALSTAKTYAPDRFASMLNAGGSRCDHSAVRFRGRKNIQHSAKTRRVADVAER
jgi:hypothetical protein